VRCVACNKPLDEDEMMIKGAHSGEFLDMCILCVKHSGIVTDLKDDDPIEPDVDGFWKEDGDDFDLGC